MNSKKVLYIVTSGMISMVLTFLILLPPQLNKICSIHEFLCVFVAFLLQAPAYIVSLLFNNPSDEFVTLIFKTATEIFWFGFGSLIGYLVYRHKAKKEKRNLKK